MDESELYEDLFEHLEDGQSVIKTSYHELEEQIQQLRNESQELNQKLTDLQAQNEKLTKQNDVLIRNISCLFKTAQMEISRKDKQIRTLQEEALKQATAGNTSQQPVADGPVNNGKDQRGLSAVTDSGNTNSRYGDQSLSAITRKRSAQAAGVDDSASLNQKVTCKTKQEFSKNRTPQQQFKDREHDNGLDQESAREVRRKPSFNNEKVHGADGDRGASRDRRWQQPCKERVYSDSNDTEPSWDRRRHQSREERSTNDDVRGRVQQQPWKHRSYETNHGYEHNSRQGKRDGIEGKN